MSASPEAAPRLSLSVQYAAGRRNAPPRHRFRAWVRRALDRDARIALRIVGAAEGRRLNRDFRGRDYATNVLTFAYADMQPLAGDMVLCAPVVEKEAREQGKSLDAHYAHLTVHGVLHLQGWLHDTDAQARSMEGLETAIVTRLGFPDPYGAAPRASATRPTARRAAPTGASAAALRAGRRRRPHHER